jgi:hypothetical protein
MPGKTSEHIQEFYTCWSFQNFSGAVRSDPLQQERGGKRNGMEGGNRQTIGKYTMGGNVS